MRAMTEIEWLDGRVTKVPELALGDALGESVQAELDFGFDDVLEGLWVEVRHHEPDEDSDGDPRGRGCALYADCRYSLVEPSDLDRVFCILYEGQPRVQPRRGGAREPFAGLRVVLPHARISLPARRPRGPGRVRSGPQGIGFPHSSAHVRMNVGGVRMKLIIKASIANAIWFLEYGRIPRQEGKMVPTAAQVVESWAEPLLNEVGSSS